jgi:adenosylcobinamide-GDP ribazoletransferase
MRRALDGLALATTFLTILPARVREGADGRWSPAWFPIVGGVAGAVGGLVRYAGDATLRALVSSVLAAIVLVVLTGALHQDGLADCADALGVRSGRERRLEVMRDPAVGTFGTLALVLWALLLVAALTGLDREDALRTLVVACTLGRWAALVHASWCPPARADGLGAAFAVSRPVLAVATACAVAIALLVARPTDGAIALGAAAVVAALLIAASRSWFGGRTGDTLGATVAVTEVVVVVALLGT